MAHNQYTMQDPRTQYPGPSFSDDTQPEPGLTDAMDPAPDHGEQTYQGAGRLEGRKALITGGDSGIGRAVAIAFAREGADVAIGYLPEEQQDAERVQELIEQAGRVAVLLPGDISDEATCKQMIDDVVSQLGGIDILVNNAGKQVTQSSLNDITTEQLDKTFRTNIYAMFWLCKAALPHMPAGATIINTTSIQSYQPSPELLDYASTKGAITAFTKALAKQAIESGIRVNAVAPGPIWTPLQPSHGQPKEKLAEFGAQSLFKRAGQPAELAPAYVYLASQESSYVTAEVIGVTGGQHLP